MIEKWAAAFFEFREGDWFSFSGAVVVVVDWYHGDGDRSYCGSSDVCSSVLDTDRLIAVIIELVEKIDLI